MISQREFIEINGELVEVLRTIREERRPIVENWKVHLQADKVFRKDGFYFFCRLIEEAVIEEIVNKPELSIDETVIEAPTENLDI